MRLLVVTETGQAWPSGFVRAHIYAPLFEKLGWSVTFATRKSEKITRWIETEHPIGSRIQRLGVGRALVSWNQKLAQWREPSIQRQAISADTVYLQKISSFRLFEGISRQSKARLVYDVNDALWLPHWKGFLDGRLQEVLSRADAITCDNRFVFEYAKSTTSKIQLVPDPPQIEAFDAKRSEFKSPTDSFVLGWIGSRNTAANLFAIYEPLEELFRRRPELQLRILGSPANNPAMPKWENVRASYVPRYGHTRMVEEALQMHAGLFPLFQSEDSRARGVLKATMYMSAGACCLASPVGECPDLIQNGINGMLPNSPSDWVDSIEKLMDDPALHERISQTGIQKMRAEYSLEQCFDSLCRALVPNEARA